MCFRGWRWNFVPKRLACLHILQIKLIIQTEMVQGQPQRGLIDLRVSSLRWKCNTEFSWHEISATAGQILTLCSDARCFLTSCCTWWSIPSTRSQTLLSTSANGARSTNVWGVCVCVCCVSGIWSTSLCPPTPVQTTTLRKVPTTLTRRWLLRGLQLSFPKPRSSPSSSIPLTELTPGTRSDARTLNLFFPSLGQLLRVNVQRLFHHFHFLFFASLPTAPKSPRWPSGTEVLFPRRHHGRPRRASQTAGPPESLSGARLVRRPPGALAQQLPLQPGTVHTENRAFSPPPSSALTVGFLFLLPSS